MKLRSVYIENFQSIKKLRLELGKTTVLVGPSDKGKSAILRAIMSVFTNPAGQSRIRHGEKASVVELTFDNDVTIGYRKSTTSAYRVQTSAGKFDFDKMGREIPAQVSELVHPWQVGDEVYYVQYQRQGEGAFVVGSANRGAVMRALDELDGKPYRKALLACQSSIRSMRRDFTTAKAEEEKLKEQHDKAAIVNQLLKIEDLAKYRLIQLERLARHEIIRILPDMYAVGLLFRRQILSLATIDATVPEWDSLAIELLLRLREIQIKAKEMAVEGTVLIAELKMIKEKLAGLKMCPLTSSGDCLITGNPL